MRSFLVRPAPIETIRPGELRRPLVMGIINATPDSFYPGSRVPGVEEAVERGMEMAQAGADILDVGGESTRPGSDEVAAEEELKRVIPVISGLARRMAVPISIDTRRPETAARALEAGATILNDIFALRAGEEMMKIAARYPVVVMMHMAGQSPKTMQENPSYRDVVEDISGFFEERLSQFEAAGGDRSRVWLDPGLGFGKTTRHNLDILSRLEEFRSLGRPLVVGASRKSFIGKVLGSEDAPVPVGERLGGSLFVACRAAEAKAACVRVHDVAQTCGALDLWASVRGCG
jgi:dihydropteroate synthase